MNTVDEFMFKRFEGTTYTITANFSSNTYMNFDISANTEEIKQGDSASFESKKSYVYHQIIGPQFSCNAMVGGLNLVKNRSYSLRNKTEREIISQRIKSLKKIFIQ